MKGCGHGGLPTSGRALRMCREDAAAVQAAWDALGWETPSSKILRSSLSSAQSIELGSASTKAPPKLSGKSHHLLEILRSSLFS